MANIKISDLAPVTLPLDPDFSFFEVQTVEAGVNVSRKITADEMGIGGAVISVNSGVNITVDNTDPLNPIVNLDAAIAGMTVNGVVLASGGVATNYLDETGAYSVPPGSGQVDSVAGGTNINISGTAIDPIVNLDAAITGVSVDGVTLTTAGVATNYLDETGAYSVPPGGSPLTTKGDVFTFDTGDQRLGVGADGEVLTANSATATGLEWAAGGGGAVSELVDGGANVALIANGSGRVALRSVGSTDAELRILDFNWQDGTNRALVGFEASDALIIRNSINNANIIFNCGIFGGSRLRLHLDGTSATGGASLYAGTSSTPRLQSLTHGVEIGNGTLFLVEQAAQEADIVGQGQLWVDSADDSLKYVTEAGVVFNLTAGAFDPTADIDFTGACSFTNAVGDLNLGVSTSLFFRNSADTSDTFLQNLGSTFQFGVAGADFGSQLIDFGSSFLGVQIYRSLFLREQAAAQADISLYGQLWVLDEGFSNSLMYTNDNGNDFEIAALNLTDMNTSSINVPTTSFVEGLTFQPDVNRDYMVTASFELQSPAADDMQVEMVIDTNAVFKGVLVYSNQSGVITGTFALESAVGDVITNIVVVPTDGSATPDGTHCTIVGALNMGATSGTHSVRVAKNADTGADGLFVAFSALQASVLQVS